MNSKIYFKILKTFFIVICVSFLLVEIYKNSNYIEVKFKDKINIILLIIFFKIIHHNLLSLRNYSIYKICANYKGKFIDWGQIFYEGLIFNTLLSHAGSVYRAIETKKRGLEYKQYSGIFYILFTSYILINVLLVTIELIFLKVVSFHFIISLLFTFLILFISAIYLPKILQKITQFDFFKINIYKYEIIKKIFEIYNLIFSFIKSQIFLKKTIIYLLGYGIIIHLLELYIFYISSKIIQTEIVFQTVLILFGLNFILDRIPFISNIPGISEALFAGISISLGFFFYEGLILKLLLRITGIISIVINYLIFYFLNLKNNISFFK